MTELATIILAAIFGSMSGSYANVAIWRWPQGRSTSDPKRSACPLCNEPIAATDNIPIVSWLLLRGKGRCCGEPISIRYPLVEAGMAVLFAAAAWSWGPSLLLPAVLVFLWSMVVATIIDLEHMIIPNRMTYRLPFVLLALILPDAIFQGNIDGLVRAVSYAVIAAGGLLLFAELFRLLRGKQGLGMGDVKLLGSIGVMVGYLSGFHLLAFFYVTVGVSAIIVLGLVASGRKRMASRIPFGPYLAVGAAVPVLAPVWTVEVLRGALGI